MASTVLRSASRVWPVASGSLSLPRIGVWKARLALQVPDDGAAPELGPCTVELFSAEGPALFVGHVKSASLFPGGAELEAYVVGAVLGDDAPARDHVQGDKPVTAATVIEAIAEGAVQLAEGVSAELAELQIERWTTAAEARVIALHRVAHRLDLAWRVTRAGELWAGQEAWPSVELPAVSERNDVDGVLVLDVEGAPFEPGIEFGGLKVERVVYDLASGSARVEYQAEGDVIDAPDVGVYGEHLQARVVAQNADDTLDLEVFDVRIAGVRQVRLDAGIPGARLLLSAGTLVRLAWRGEDPRSPYAYAIAQVPGAARGVARVGDTGSGGSLSATAPPGGGPVTFVYTPPGGAPLGGSPTVALSIVIETGSAKVLLED